jgi:hypothetical protein
MPDVPPTGPVLEDQRGPAPIRGVETGVAGFVGVTERGPATATLVTSWNDFETTFGAFIDRPPFVTPYWRLPYAVRAFFENGGRRAWIARVLDAMSTDGADDAQAIAGRSDEPTPTGLAALADIADVELVAAPDDIAAPPFAAAVVRHCETSRHRLAIVDVPAAPDPRVTPPPPGSSLEARYFPRLHVAAPHLAAGYAVVPPCGHVMGRLAATPVGTRTPPDPRLAPDSLLADGHPSGAGVMDAVVTAVQADPLVRAGVNVVRDFRAAGRGVQIWGGRTAIAEGEWKYVNVRRLLMYLERSIDTGLQWAVFEPNGDALWLRVRAAIETFLTGCWRSGALAGATPERAFFVKCDRTTMTQNDLDNGRLVVEIGVAPLRPAEFVIFRIGRWIADPTS